MPTSDERASAVSSTSATTPGMFIKRPPRLLMLDYEIFKGTARAANGSVGGVDVAGGVGGGVDALMKTRTIFSRAVVVVGITSLYPSRSNEHDTRHTNSRWFIPEYSTGGPIVHPRKLPAESSRPHQTVN